MKVIRKDPALSGVTPNVLSYDDARSTFSWDAARAELDPRSDNIAFQAIDRHVSSGRGDHLAIRWISKQGEVRDFTFKDLYEETSRFANALDTLGVERGDRIFALCGRIPELYITALGTLRHGSVFSPLFSAFGPDPIRQRILRGKGRVLVTTPSLYEKKIAGIRADLETLEHILLVGDAGDVPGTRDWRTLVENASTEHVIPPTDPESMALLHFTSGTTGMPKGAVHVHRAVVAHHSTGRSALDLHPDDVFWCTADPGWVTGTSYGIISPLTNGVTSIVDEAEFDADRWYRIIQEQHVTVWYTAPTAVRMLMRVGLDATRDYDLSSLRFIASVGEPLNPEAVTWGVDAFGMPIHDNWWQTETGGIMIANLRSMDVKPGSMGRPLPGVDAAILRRDEDDKVVCTDGEPLVAAYGEEGELALRPDYPSMFRAYLDEPERYAKCFVGGWYLTGDLARMDEDGYFWFVGRGDDVIKSAGHLIGPIEVESALMEHPAVAEAGVIGKPDPVAKQIVKAFVTLHHDAQPSDALRRELIAFGRKRLGAAVAPREIDFAEVLPKTRSGKIMRRLLRARELGLPEGDTSTLEAS